LANEDLMHTNIRKYDQNGKNNSKQDKNYYQPYFPTSNDNITSERETEIKSIQKTDPNSVRTRDNEKLNNIGASPSVAMKNIMKKIDYNQQVFTNINYPK